MAKEDYMRWHLQSENDIIDAQIDWAITYYACLMKDGTIRKFAQFYDECADGSVSHHLECFEKDCYTCDDILYWTEIPEDFIKETTKVQ